MPGPQSRAALCAQAYAWLCSLGVPNPQRGFRVVVECGDETHELRCEAPCGTMRPEERPGRWLSPLEEQILAALADGGWRSSGGIAGSLGLADAERLKAVLTNLVDREILESAPGRGYRRAGL